VESVKSAGQPVATVDSVAENNPAHLPAPPGTSFQRQPANRGTVVIGSQTVKIGGKAAARANDPVSTCNDPADAPTGAIVCFSTVKIGG
jgi:uncharacterized Zn-binding protein involved in type VI secretion